MPTVKTSETILAKYGRHKRFWDDVKQCKQNNSCQNKEGKVDEQFGGEFTRTNQQQGVREKALL